MIRYPHVGLLAEIGRSLGTRISYLIATGDLELGDLELIEAGRVAPSDRPTAPVPHPLTLADLGEGLMDRGGASVSIP